MGFTHYFTQKRDFTETEWRAVRLAARRILDACQDIALVYEYDCANRPPLVDDEQIRFNGAGDEGHETFLVTRKTPPLAYPGATSGFRFCKTARKPYDLTVCLVLLAIYQLAPNAMDISSDGDWDVEWRDARLTYPDIFGVEPAAPFPSRVAMQPTFPGQLPTDE